MGVAHHIAPYSTKNVTQLQHIFTPFTGIPAITSSFRTVTDRDPGLSSSMAMCPEHYNVDKYFYQSCEKLTDVIKHSDIIDTPEFLIIHFK